MRRFFNFQLICVLTMMLLGGVVAPTAQAEGKRKAWSAADGAFYLKTSDGLETYEVDGTTVSYTHLDVYKRQDRC